MDWFHVWIGALSLVFDGGHVLILVEDRSKLIIQDVSLPYALSESPSTLGFQRCYSSVLSPLAVDKAPKALRIGGYIRAYYVIYVITIGLFTCHL